MNDLTLVLPIKGREFYSRRLLAYLYEIECPFPLVIADGGEKDSRIQKSIESNYYDGLKIEYLRFPYDKTVQDFYGKVARSLLAVETPLCMVIDNDDFFTINGIKSCIDFLNKNRDFCSARGGKTGVHIGERGIEERSPMYTEFPESITGDTSAERIHSQATRFHSNWHNVIRTQSAQMNWSILWYLSPSNLRFCDQMIGFLSIIWGDGMRDNSFCHIIHEHGTPRVEGGERHIHFPDQNTWIRQGEWPENFAKMTDGIAFAMSMCDGEDFDVCRDHFRKCYIEMYPPRVDAVDLLVSKIDESKKYCDDSRLRDLQTIVGSLNPFNIDLPEQYYFLEDTYSLCEEEIDNLQGFLRTMS